MRWSEDPSVIDSRAEGGAGHVPSEAMSDKELYLEAHRGDQLELSG